MVAPASAVLIVEDDAATRHLLEAVVLRHRLSAALAADGRSALQQLATAEFDLILLDLFLPDLDGRDILAWLASTRPHLLRRVVVVTSALEAEYRACEAIRLVWSIIRKPFELRVLEAQILECCAANPAKSA